MSINKEAKRVSATFGCPDQALILIYFSQNWAPFGTLGKILAEKWRKW